MGMMFAMKLKMDPTDALQADCWSDSELQELNVVIGWRGVQLQHAVRDLTSFILYESCG